MRAEIFVDANILVYAHDLDAGDKHERAKTLIRDLWNRPQPPAISVQVLQEVFVNLHRHGVALTEAREVLRDYRCWCAVDNTAALCDRAVGEMERWQTSFWDALILAAARSTGASVLWSEDFSTGQDYGGIRVVNPLIPVDS
jgi:predicted nucleic acid-binding protein